MDTIRELRLALQGLEAKILSGELDEKGIRRYVRNMSEYWRKRGYNLGDLIRGRGGKTTGGRKRTARVVSTGAPPTAPKPPKMKAPAKPVSNTDSHAMPKPGSDEWHDWLAEQRHTRKDPDWWPGDQAVRRAEMAYAIDTDDELRSVVSLWRGYGNGLSDAEVDDLAADLSNDDLDTVIRSLREGGNHGKLIEELQRVIKSRGGTPPARRAVKRTAKPKPLDEPDTSPDSFSFALERLLSGRMSDGKAEDDIAAENAGFRKTWLSNGVQYWTNDDGVAIVPGDEGLGLPGRWYVVEGEVGTDDDGGLMGVQSTHRNFIEALNAAQQYQDEIEYERDWGYTPDDEVEGREVPAGVEFGNDEDYDQASSDARMAVELASADLWARLPAEVHNRIMFMVRKGVSIDIIADYLYGLADIANGDDGSVYEEFADYLVDFDTHSDWGEEEKAITPGGRVGDATSRNISPKKNWVEKAGGLPRYMRMVRNALLRKGKTMGAAHRLAIGIVKNWAEGKGNVSPKVRAAAVKAVAEWETKKAKAHATKSLELKDRIGRMMRAASRRAKNPSSPRGHYWRGSDGKRRVFTAGVFFDRHTGAPLHPGDELRRGEYVFRRPVTPAAPAPRRAPSTTVRTPTPPAMPMRPTQPRQAAVGDRSTVTMPTVPRPRRITQQELFDLVTGQQEVSRKPLGQGYAGGTGAVTEEVMFRSGRRAIHKRFETIEEARAEYLGSRVGQAIGAPVPTIIFDQNDPDQKTLWIEHVPGEIFGGRSFGKARVMDYRIRRAMSTEDAVLLGLLDVLGLNRDRNPGNHLFDQADNPTGIDHGEMFQYAGLVGTRPSGRMLPLPDFERRDIRQNRGPYARFFIQHNGAVIDDRDGTVLISQDELNEWLRRNKGYESHLRLVWGWRPNPLTEAKAAQIESQLRALYREFQQARRTYWYDDLMARWKQVRAHATGVDTAAIVAEIVKEFAQ